LRPLTSSGLLIGHVAETVLPGAEQHEARVGCEPRKPFLHRPVDRLARLVEIVVEERQRHRGERLVVFAELAGCRQCHVDHPVAGLLEHLVGISERIGGKDLHLDRAVGARGDFVGKLLRGCAHRVRFGDVMTETQVDLSLGGDRHRERGEGDA